MSETAAWVPDAEVAADEPQDVRDAPAEAWAASVPSWLPLSAQRAIAHENWQEERAAREVRRAREARDETRREADLQMFREQSEARGDYFGVLDLAAGNVPGRSIEDVFRSAAAAADADDRRAEARARNTEFIGVAGPSIGRSAGMLSYEAERMIDRAAEDREWFIAYRARHQYGRALDVTRSKATPRGAKDASVARSASPVADRVEELVAAGFSYDVAFRACNVDVP